MGDRIDRYAVEVAGGPKVLSHLRQDDERAPLV